MQKPKKPASVPAALVASASEFKQGAETLLDWLGDGGIPVTEPAANLRAVVCTQCPRNRKVKWYEFIKTSIATAVMAQERIRVGARMSTIFDPKLGICDPCGCYLKLKVWVPIEHIIANLDPAELTELAPQCWVLKEKKDHE